MTTQRLILFGLVALALHLPVVAAADTGKDVYGGSCIACHGADGQGTLPGLPDFTKIDGVLSQSDAVLVKRVTDGFQSPGSPMAMPPKGGNPELADKQVREALEYLRRTFHP